MRIVLFAFILMVAFMLPKSQASAQQLSSHMNDVLAQEGQIEHYVESGSENPVFVTIGPDSRKDRRFILAHCETVLEENWQIVEKQYGYSEARKKMTNTLAAGIDLLNKARRSKEGMANLRWWASQFENDYNGSGRNLNCILGKALEMAGGGASAGTPAPVAVADPVQATPKPSQLSDEQRVASMNAVRDEFKAFSARYPVMPHWTENENNQYNLFAGTKSLEILDRYKLGMEKEDYDTIAASVFKLLDRGRAGCPVCKIEYPQVAPQVSVAATPVTPSEGGVMGILNNSLVGGGTKKAPVPPAVESPATKKVQPPKITMMAALGNGCVTAIGRNYRLHEFDKSTQLIDLVLKNSCGKAQVVKVDVSGLGMLGWPAIYNLGLWASTANADVPAGIPFNPLRAMSEGGTYMIPANGEHVADRWVPPPPIGSDNELKIWVASCDAYSSLGMQQVVFRPAAHFSQDSRAFCGPSRLR